MDAKTFLALGTTTEGEDMDYDSEVVLIVLAASIGATQSYSVQRNGWIQNIMSTVGTAWTLCLNIDPPAQITSAGTYSGSIWYGTTGTMADRVAAQSPMRVEVKEGDIIRAKNFAASLTSILVVLSYPRETTRT